MVGGDTLQSNSAGAQFIVVKRFASSVFAMKLAVSVLVRTVTKPREMEMRRRIVMTMSVSRTVGMGNRRELSSEKS
jgi:hypothetical protein